MARPFDRCPAWNDVTYRPLREQYAVLQDLEGVITRDLSERARDHFPEDPEAADLLLKVLPARVHSLVGAGFQVALSGWGEAALIVGRSAFECMLDAYWAANNRDLVEERLHRHFQLWSARDSAVQDVESDPPWAQLLQQATLELGIGQHPSDPVPQSGEEARKLIGAENYRSSWTGIDMHSRASALVDAELEWPIPETSEGELNALVKTVIAETNLRAHTSLYAVESVYAIVGPEAPGRVPHTSMVRRGTDPRRIPLALFLLGYCLVQSEKLSAALFDRPATTFDSALEELTLVTRPVLDSDLKRAGRNGTCPCGSGRKAKRCHGGTPIDEEDLGLVFMLIREGALLSDQPWGNLPDMQH